jgi:hypothetical protein
MLTEIGGGEINTKLAKIDWVEINPKLTKIGVLKPTQS